MSGQELIELVVAYRWHAFFVLAATTIQISPLKLEPWTYVGNVIKWVFKKFGHLLSPLILDDVRGINKELLADMDEKFESVKKENRENSEQQRSEFQQFKRENDEFRHQVTLKINDFANRVSMLDENLQGARQDSIDRYNKSHDEYQNMREDFNDKIKELEELVKYEINATKLELMRPVILKFSGEVNEGVYFDKENWDTLKDACVKYMNFCHENNQFVNSMIEGAITNILRRWETEPWKKVSQIL